MMKVKEEILHMDALSKLERTIKGWLKDVPHLPAGVRTWLGDNVWWIVVIGTVLTGIGALGLLGALITHLTSLGSPVVSYYASTTFVGWLIVNAAVGLFFTAIEFLLMAFAISPLKAKQKKGWVLLFASWLVAIIAMVVGAVLTLNPLGFVGNLIFGTLWIAVTAYFLFEIHGEFAHVERSNGVKGKKTS